MYLKVPNFYTLYFHSTAREVFLNQLLPRYEVKLSSRFPAVFDEWFLQTPQLGMISSTNVT